MTNPPTVKVTIETPIVPNFFRMTNGQYIPVCTLTEDRLRRIAATWKRGLLAEAKRQKEAGMQPTLEREIHAGTM
jgi:hypothetical protein